MMKKISKTTLDFINENININAQASSYPLRKQHDITDTPTKGSAPQLNSQPTTSSSSPACLATLKIAENYS